MRDLLRYNLRTVRSYLLREQFQFFWTYTSATWAGKFLDRWCTQALRSRIEPMRQVARMLRRHRPLLLNYFRAKRALSAAVVEGFNNKARVTTRTAYGFRDVSRHVEIARWLSQPGRLTRTENSPQILLRRQISSLASSSRASFGNGDTDPSVGQISLVGAWRDRLQRARQIRRALKGISMALGGTRLLTGRARALRRDGHLRS